MNRRILMMLILGAWSVTTWAQSGSGDLKMFGYFQAALGHQKDVGHERVLNTFTLQQLNLFLQKDVMQSWSAFINFELVNSYSSLRNWGAFSLEEAWVNYRRSKQFQLKLGLLTPAFNNLNEIKNRTPLLPYIIRPVVYESSFSEEVATEDFAPGRAYVQVYGFIPQGAMKWDYAIYLGNSPNINTDPRLGVTGVDTTRSFLVGGRLGMRRGFFKTGVSLAHDNLDAQVLHDTLGVPREKLRSTPRLRTGADLSFSGVTWLLEAEYIHVSYDAPFTNVDFDQRFFYATLGYRVSERMLAYVSYWDAHARSLPIAEEGFQVPTLGVAYDVNEMIVIKFQTAGVQFERENRNTPKFENTYNYTYCAVSVRF